MTDFNLEPALLFLWEREFFRPFDHLSALGRFVEDGLTRDRENLERAAANLGKEWRLPADQRNASWIYPEDHVQVAQVYPRLLRYSLVALGYSVLVTKLNELCELGGAALGTSIAYDDLRNDRGELYRARTYLQKVLGVDVQAVSWDTADRVRRLRNRIVHNEGRIDQNAFRSEFAAFTTSPALLLLHKSERIEVQPRYGEWFVNEARGWIDGLYRGNPKAFRPRVG